MSITTLLWEGGFWVLSETSCYTNIKRHIPVSNTIVITTILTYMTTNLGRSTVTFFPSLYMSITTLLWEGRFWVVRETSGYTHIKRYIPVGNATAGEHTRVLLWRGPENTLKYLNPFPLFQNNMDHTCFFHASTFAGFGGSCLNMRQIGRVLEHLSCFQMRA